MAPGARATIANNLVNPEIIATAPRSLARGGTLLLEHGYDQARAVRELLAARGFRGIETHTDFAGHDRVSLGSVP